MGGTWRRFPCSLFSNTPGTHGAWRSAEIAVVAPPDYQRDDLEHLRGKAVIHLGCHIESRESYQRLMAAGPAFLLMVDTRYPGTTPLADGMFPAYTAGDWRRAHAERRLSGRLGLGCGKAPPRLAAAIVGGMSPGTSQNIVIDLSGTDLRDEVLYVGAHHDTQAASPGADDNASGVIGVLELARLLHGCRRRRTIRLISFGAEEQFSVGLGERTCAMHRRDVSAPRAIDVQPRLVRVSTGWLQLHVNGHSDFELLSVRTSAPPTCTYQTITEGGPCTPTTFRLWQQALPRVFHHRVELRRGPFLPSSSRRRPEPGIGGCHRAGRLGGRHVARPDGHCSRRCRSRLESPSRIDPPSRLAGKICSVDGMGRDPSRRTI